MRGLLGAPAVCGLHTLWAVLGVIGGYELTGAD